MITKYLSDMMVKPGKSPVFGSPKDFGLEYEDVTFKASDGITLSGWMIKGGTEKIVIQSHFGVQCSRSGYTPKGKGLVKLHKTIIQFLGHARHLVDEGYSVLMYDLRNHGNSGKGTYPWITWGPDESKDVIAAVDFISKHSDYRESQIGLLSICMGASATTYAYGIENGLKRFKNIKAMIAVQPLTYHYFIRAMGIPSFFSKRVTKMIQKRTGIDFETTSFLPYAKDITVPTMVIQNTNDPMTNMDFVNQYHDTLTVEKEMLWLDLDKNRAAAYNYLPRNPETISKFFGRYIK
jgi:dipeptidyl aminopeptidase/acylaminoacyl peptidase